MSTIKMLELISIGLQKVGDDAEANAARVDAATAKMTTSASAARTLAAEVARTTADVASQIEGLGQRAFDKLDALRDRLKDFSGGWTEELKLALAALDAGAIKVDDFLVKWGDAQVLTEDGSKRIRELLDGLDLGSRTKQLQDFIRGLQSGAKDLDDVRTFLANTGFAVAKQLADMIDLFKKGKASIDQVASLIASIKKQFAGSDLASLTDAIEQAMRGGKL